MSNHSQKHVFEELASIQQRLADLFRRMVARRGKAASWPSAIKPRTNVYDDKDRTVFTLELHGVERKDIQVSLYGDLLTVRAECKLTSQEQKSNLRWSECVKGSLVSSFYLPEDADVNAIQVEYENGILRIEVLKRSYTESKRIPIRPDSPVAAA
jgi:HSP20 family protein